jgi:exosortase B
MYSPPVERVVLRTPTAPSIGYPGLLLLLTGFAVMYGAMYQHLALHYWNTEDEAHGPLIVMVCLYFTWTKRAEFHEAARYGAPRPALGSVLFGLGLLSFLIGGSQDVLLLELCSQILVLAGLVLLFRGSACLRVMQFPLLFLAFMFPLPSSLIDGITQPLKSGVSWATDQILYEAGYPIARQGVILAIGQYQLMVADACSGLRSITSLSALGVLFIYITGRASWLHKFLMLASILPLAMIANLIRVIALVLITYHLGDEAGQGYLHGTAGMVMFMVAMLGLISWDSILARVLPAAAISRKQK